jgi:GT2 family glycosyltransferase
MTPQVNVIILNWNGEKLLREYLPEVIANTDSDIARVIVADNGSTDGSISLLESEFSEVCLWKFDRNYGFAEGYNRALEMSDTPYTILLNSDVAPAKGWVNPLLDYMERNADVGACQPKLLSRMEPDKFEYAGAAGGFLDRNGYPYCRGRIFATCETDHGQYDDVMDIFWATGAALMIRTDLYRKAGGLDARFFAHMEEIDLCWRVLLAGYRIVAVPSAVVYHLGGGSLPASNPRKTYLNFRNNLLMLHKNLPAADCRSALIRRRLLDTIAWAKFMATFDWKNASAIIKAHRDFADMRKQYTEHPAVNLLKTLRSARRNILIEYYACGRKTFSSLSEQ